VRHPVEKIIEEVPVRVAHRAQGRLPPLERLLAVADPVLVLAVVRARVVKIAAALGRVVHDWLVAGLQHHVEVDLLIGDRSVALAGLPSGPDAPALEPDLEAPVETADVLLAPLLVVATVLLGPGLAVAEGLPWYEHDQARPKDHLAWLLAASEMSGGLAEKASAIHGLAV
jgi:hypothetical protein